MGVSFYEHLLLRVHSLMECRLVCSHEFALYIKYSKVGDMNFSPDNCRSFLEPLRCSCKTKPKRC